MSVGDDGGRITTVGEAQAEALTLEAVVDAYVLCEADEVATLTAIVRSGTDREKVRTELEDLFEGRTVTGVVWTFEILEGEVPP